MALERSHSLSVHSNVQPATESGKEEQDIIVTERVHLFFMIRKAGSPNTYYRQHQTLKLDNKSYSAENSVQAFEEGRMFSNIIRSIASEGSP